MGRMINDYSAYVVSEEFIRRDQEQDTKALIEKQAKEDEAWLEAKMAEFAKANNMEELIEYAPTTRTTMEDLKTKKCPACGEEKPVDEFYLAPERKDGLSYQCKACQRKSVAESKRKSREMLKAEKEAANPAAPAEAYVPDSLAYAEYPDIEPPKATEATEAPKATDLQVGGDHYKRFEIQPIEFIQRNGLPFIEGNVVKYVCRHRYKNGREDLLKARHYIDMLIELKYPEQ